MVLPEDPIYSQRLNYRIINIFRKEGIPVRVAHKSHTLRRALSQNNTERTCTRANCPISNTKLCLLRNAVYQITCNNCNQHYIGSTARFIHDRAREHLNNDNSSVKKHISKCQNKIHKGIAITTSVLENDPANLPLFEALCIRKYKPTLHSRERNAANSQTFYSNNYFSISRDSLYFYTRPLDHIIRFYSYLYLLFISYILPLTFFSLFTRFYFSSVYKRYAEYFLLILDDAVDRRKLGF